MAMGSSLSLRELGYGWSCSNVMRNKCWVLNVNFLLTELPPPSFPLIFFKAGTELNFGMDLFLRFLRQSNTHTKL